MVMIMIMMIYEILCNVMVAVSFVPFLVKEGIVKIIERKQSGTNAFTHSQTSAKENIFT